MIPLDGWQKTKAGSGILSLLNFKTEEDGMGGIINAVIGIVAAVLLYRNQQTFVLCLCVFSIGVSIWSYGVMHNYTMDLAKERVSTLRRNMEYEGMDISEIKRADYLPLHPTEKEINAVPNWLSLINMFSAGFNVVFLIYGLAS